MPSPSQPGHASRAPTHTKKTVATSCQAKWWADSSEVSQPAKKLGTMRGPRARVGR
jgi:hypothetical protein